MNDAEKEEFNRRFGKCSQAIRIDRLIGWVACREWRDSQVGEPKAWGNLSENFADSDRVLITNEPDAKKYHDQVYDLTPLYTTPPAAQINQKLVDAVEALMFSVATDKKKDESYRQGLEALAATQMRGDA